MLGNTPFVSSVDSGNFVASLYTLHTGAMDVARKPLLRPQSFAGLRTSSRMLRKEKKLWSSLQGFTYPSESMSIVDRLTGCPGPGRRWPLPILRRPAQRPSVVPGGAARRVDAIFALLHDYLPWACRSSGRSSPIAQLSLDDKSYTLTIKDALPFAEALGARLLRVHNVLKEDRSLALAAERLRALLPAAMQHLRTLFADLGAVEQDAARIAEDTDFSVLVNRDRQILSIGYERGAPHIHTASYDMIASEARIATFLAIARGDLPHQSWYKLARDHTYA